jgi:hypothetical protein
VKGFREQPGGNAQTSKKGEIMSEKREAMVVAVGTKAHEDWRAGYRAANGDKPRIKTTKDAAWVEAHGTDQVDIAGLTFSELPSDWQEENRLNAEVAVDLVLGQVEDSLGLGSQFIEKASAKVHVEWLKRNPWAPEAQKKTYAELEEAEKEKDRFVVRAAIDAYRA